VATEPRGPLSPPGPESSRQAIGIIPPDRLPVWLLPDLLPSGSLRYTAFGGLPTSLVFPHASLSVGPTLGIASVHRLRRPPYFPRVPPRLVHALNFGVGNLCPVVVVQRALRVREVKHQDSPVESDSLTATTNIELPMSILLLNNP